eukprot:scaffold33044_cov36-Prasinocladus_malaysianus.AAC.1
MPAYPKSPWRKRGRTFGIEGGDKATNCCMYYCIQCKSLFMKGIPTCSADVTHGGRSFSIHIRTLSYIARDASAGRSLQTPTNRCANSVCTDGLQPRFVLSVGSCRLPFAGQKRSEMCEINESINKAADEQHHSSSSSCEWEQLVNTYEELHRFSQCRWSHLGHKLTARGYALLAVKPRR